ncbi:[acyl-carrier-protein] S-malonyltransferase [Thermosulfidibacter takaii ABI70S6]|uniref:Malonyl CoA-acyl carrier protein transacylase n=1 Tax=Thermosulfidibacter takaii (strain DSM 17441 / JCM 13301 / NBRC 103674 / ABI70S6) TaxID=1298851 RepID=A0A0S3QUX8_THET7|nr:ACP S-malonyltransferase [Thermosulfidibacter takaii]BAT72115.1 [acyl-carrier-protein] S-malonyltransferase [Thermosulfidibacter takaii ABI70S6]
MAVAVVFPGQGSQYLGMGKDFFDAYPVVRDVFARASEKLGIDMAKLCFDSSEEELTLTENTQPSILTVSYAIYEVIKDRLPLVSFFAGHSLGEYTACVAAGILPFEDAVFAVRNRGRFMQEATPVGTGAMAAIIGLPADVIEEVCNGIDGVVQPANYNSPEQIVIAGEKAAVEKAAELLKEKGAKRVVMLKVSAPFHCQLMRPAAEKLANILKGMSFNDAKVPVVSNVTAQEVTEGEKERQLLIEQVTAPVRWYQSVIYMKENGVDTFIEVGPSRVLSGLIKKTNRKLKCINVEKVSDLEKLEDLP